MELTKKTLLCILCILCIPLIVFAVEQKIFVDSNFNEHNLYNISNITIKDIFTDGTATLKGGAFTGVGSIAGFYNSTETDAAIVTANGSLKSYVDTADTALNTSVKAYADAQDIVANDSVKAWTLANIVSWVGNFTAGIVNYYNKTQTDSAIVTANSSMKSYADAQDQIINDSATEWNNTQNFPVGCPSGSFITNLSQANTCTAQSYNTTNQMFNAVDNTTFIKFTDESSLDVNGSDYWDTLGAQTDITDVGTLVDLNVVGNISTGDATTEYLHKSQNTAFLWNGTTGTTPASGTGTRFMWIPAKGSIRAGYTWGTGWDNSQVGDHSAAFGEDNVANGSHTFVAGVYNIVDGWDSVAFGDSNTVWGAESIVVGKDNTVHDRRSAVFGYTQETFDDYAFTAGSYNTLYGLYNTVLGTGSKARGSYSMAFGQEIEAGGTHTFAFALNDQNSYNCTQDNSMCIMGGNVGIGTGTPSSKLEITGELNVSGISGDGAGQVVCIKANGALGTCDSGVNATGFCTCT